MDPIAMVTALGTAATKIAAEVQQHEALKNSPEMQKAAILDQLQAVIDQHRNEIANEDIEAYRLAVAATPT